MSYKEQSPAIRLSAAATMPVRAYAVIAAGFFTFFIAYAIRYGYGLLLPHMAETLAITNTQAGVIYASYFFTYTLFSPLIGLMADRCDIRRLLTVFSALLGLGAILMACTDSVLSASLFFMVSGIGHSACFAPVMALVQKWVPDRRRGVALAVTTLGAGAGSALWSLILPVIIEAWGWRGAWVSLGIFGLGIAGLNYLLVRDRALAAPLERAAAPTSLAGEYRRLLARPLLWYIGLSYLMVGYTVIVPYTFLAAYATQVLAMPYTQGAKFFAAISVAGIAGKLSLGVLSDRLGRVPMMMLCGLLLGLGNVGFIYGKGVGSIYLATIAFGLGFGAVWPLYAAAAPDFFERRSAGGVIGIWTFLMGVGSIVSPILCGRLIDHYGSYGNAFGSGVVAALLSLALLLPAVKARPRIDPRGQPF